MSLHDQTRTQARLTGRIDAEKGLDKNPARYNALSHSAWAKWYCEGYDGAITIPEPAPEAPVTPVESETKGLEGKGAAEAYTVFFTWPSGTIFIGHLEILEPDAFSGDVEQTAREYFAEEYQYDKETLAEWNAATYCGCIRGKHDVEWNGYV